ncbi:MULTISPECIES: endonuclease/exonuclease/phosphatase family protein [Segatella]|jgi:endonuclease/exonuclease/phosphatase family metal-dependent hydrolase|uniref:Endonuclease/exonuclease/phosphatase family protein n=2 Tax=Segatella TaxID=2974251 RepID=D8DUU7_9BACT|nr:MULTISPECIES: endonuclease/exonuclease/phosphatase family protein [Segatella]ABY53604.1 non-specific nuclease [Segatella bryantii]EFI72787.1 endonuclease/exonuclease/phosphatase family protein [Segatella baroniae B14]OYP56321.1 endonuclease [Segatella bryantii]UKK73142.1 endonuclease/exonuclease/phosphatase family protein [Segatella bryantii]UKK77291.1 endonuclease/exonuclease/phosphatase family protein [Segatella baroniae B14]
MKKNILLLAAWFMACLTVSAQKSFVGYAIGFYNQENLFDTCHDEGKNDYEYLPAKGWNGLKYSNKLKNMAQVLSEMGTDVIPVGCAAIGLAEVENDNVLKDLVAQPALAKRGFNFVHIEGPDRRGIDCALLYNPQLFQVRNVKLVPYVQELKKDSAFYTRGFLTVSGTLANEHVTIIVCHLPSRFSASFYRESGARQIKVVKDSLLREDPTCKVIVMGDMNDDPEDASMYKELAAKENINKVKADEMFNPWYNVHQSGTGTLSYQGAWNLFDQIILSPTLINQNGSKDYSTLKYWKNQIFRRDYMFQTEGKYKGSPKRTTAGGVWLNGYSDHLPTVVYLLKEKK